MMEDRNGIFAGDNPFDIAKSWLAEAEVTEPNDPSAAAMASVDASGMPNVRMVLIKGFEPNAFVFYTNYTSTKAEEILSGGKASFVWHWKSLRRQIRVRGLSEKEEGPTADTYYQSRGLGSRLGAWASDQSSPLATRGVLEARAAEIAETYGDAPPRPPFWGGIRIRPVEMEFWADGANRLHDRFKWARETPNSDWDVTRLFP